MTVIRKAVVLAALILLTAVSVGSGTLMAWRAVLHTAQSQVFAVTGDPVARPRPAPRAPIPPRAADAPGAVRAPQAATAPLAPRAVARQPVGQSPDDSGVQIRRIGRPVFRLGEGYRLPAGESVSEVVVVSGSAVIEGTVERDVVVVVGRLRLASTAVIYGQLTVVGGSLDIEPGADVRRELVVIGGAFNAPPEFSAGGQHVVIGQSLIGNRIDAVVPWVTGGLLWGRPLVLGVGWVWGVVLTCLLVYLIVALLFTGSMRTSSEAVARRPLGSFLTGLLVLLLFGPVVFILAVSIVGIVVIPFVLCALVIAWIVGKVGVLRWIGSTVMAEEDPESKFQSVRSFLIGFAIVTGLYLVPILGIVSWATIGVLSVGSAWLSFMTALRKENPNGSRRKVPPPVPPAPPVVPPPPSGPSTGGMPGYEAHPAAFAAVEEAPAGTSPTTGWASQAGAAAVPAAAASYAPPSAAQWAPAGPTDLVTMPRAPFLHRLAAFALDVILVLFITGFIAPRWMREGEEQFFFFLFVYHVAFWTWKGTTVGGIICNLRLVRTDGAALRFADTLLRGLAGIFSIVCAGLGFIWILRDPESQAWHDRIAGTYVVKVPRSYAIT